jgi:hypothetical protein
MMTSAIGKAATKATAIVEAWRTLSTDMLLAPPRGIQNAVAGTMP